MQDLVQGTGLAQDLARAMGLVQVLERAMGREKAQVLLAGKSLAAPVSQRA